VAIENAIIGDPMPREGEIIEVRVAELQQCSFGGLADRLAAMTVGIQYATRSPHG
jgi:hypothetical protein